MRHLVNSSQTTRVVLVVFPLVSGCMLSQGRCTIRDSWLPLCPQQSSGTSRIGVTSALCQVEIPWSIDCALHSECNSLRVKDQSKSDEPFMPELRAFRKRSKSIKGGRRRFVPILCQRENFRSTRSLSRPQTQSLSKQLCSLFGPFGWAKMGCDYRDLESGSLLSPDLFVRWFFEFDGTKAREAWRRNI